MEGTETVNTDTDLTFVKFRNWIHYITHARPCAFLCLYGRVHACTVYMSLFACICVCTVCAWAAVWPHVRHMRGRESERKEEGGLLGQTQPDLSQEPSLRLRMHSFHHHGDGGVLGGMGCMSQSEGCMSHTLQLNYWIRPQRGVLPDMVQGFRKIWLVWFPR